MMPSFIHRHLHRSSLPRRCVAAVTPIAHHHPHQPHHRHHISSNAALITGNSPGSILLRSSRPRPFATSSGRRVGQPGQGGLSEERMIAQAIRTIGERQYPVVIEVINACHVDWASRQLPSRALLRRNAKLWVRVLTHADLLSEEALRYQMERASIMVDNDEEYDMSMMTMADATKKNKNNNITSDYRIPVIALNLSDVEAGVAKGKALRPVKELLLGAKMIVGQATKTPKILVCGLPNAGKSSFIYPLTKHRTMTIKKKKDYHLPKINKTAGWTLSTKSHAFEIKILKDSKNGGKHHKKETVSLTDTPGMRPRLEDISHDKLKLAEWLATWSVKPQKGDLSQSNEDAEELRTHILNVLWKGLKRHAELSSERLQFETPEDLWKRHTEEDKKEDTVHQFINSVHEGDYGAMIIEDENTAPVMMERIGGEPSQYGPMAVNMRAKIVAVNHGATALISVGTAKRAPDDERNSKLFVPKLGSKSGRQQGEITDNNYRNRQEQQSDKMAKNADKFANKSPPPRMSIAAKGGNSVTVYIGNLSYSVDEKLIRETFEDCGEIVSVRLAKTHPDASGAFEGSGFKGFGHVDFADVESTHRAIELAGSYVMGRPIRVDYDRPKGRDVGGGDRIVRLPEHQTKFECMKCAGFVKRSKMGEIVGSRHTRVINCELRAIARRVKSKYLMRIQLKEKHSPAKNNLALPSPLSKQIPPMPSKESMKNVTNSVIGGVGGFVSMLKKPASRGVGEGDGSGNASNENNLFAPTGGQEVEVEVNLDGTMSTPDDTAFGFPKSPSNPFTSAASPNTPAVTADVGDELEKLSAELGDLSAATAEAFDLLGDDFNQTDLDGDVGHSEELLDAMDEKVDPFAAFAIDDDEFLS